jgi:carbon monoxide dehydrogenase subunit G
MATFEISLFIDRPPQEIFDFMTNPDNDKLWQESLISSEWVTEGPAGLGSKKRVVVRFMGFKLKATTEYVIWEPPERYRFKSDDSPFSVVGTTRFEPEGEGTQVTTEGQIEASGLLKLVVGIMARQAEKEDKAHFNNLKRILEEDPS